MGKWQEVKPRPWPPCDGCEMGSCSISQKTVGGKLYTKTDDCHETCGRYLSHINRPEPLFGQNIKDTIASIRGK